MDSSQTDPIELGGRTLAAIVFTDVVSFSARVQAKEVPTLSLLEQDFIVMRKYCKRYSGSVLKSTGDGLLLYFASAVHAVRCAVKIQRFFAKRAKAEPDAGALVHRVGVHLGDVFATEQDVMGDGVNVAARLQAVADPGGICISQTVYDVVRNKLELEVERLNPRDQKNISEIGPLYRVLLESRKTDVAPAAYRLPDRTPRAVFSRTEKLIALALVVLVLAAVARQLMQEHTELKESLSESQATQSALDVLLTKKAPGQPGSSTVENAGVAAPVGPEDFHFRELALKPADGTGGTEPRTAVLRAKAVEATGVLVTWIKSAMNRYSKDGPLLVRRSNGPLPVNFKVFPDSGQRFVFAKNGATRSRAWEELELADQEALIVSILLDSPTPPPPEVIRGADAFAYLHHLPDMVDALHPGQR